MIIENGILKKYTCAETAQGEVIIPDGVVRIGGRTEDGESASENPHAGNPAVYDVFSDREAITSVRIPDSVRELGEGALAGCTGLRALYLPKNIRWIESRALPETRIEDVYYDGTIGELDRQVFFGTAKFYFHYVHCTDCTVDFTKELCIDELGYPGTKEECHRHMNTKGSWIYRRTRLIHCTDGDIVQEHECTSGSIRPWFLGGLYYFAQDKGKITESGEEGKLQESDPEHTVHA